MSFATSARQWERATSEVEILTDWGFECAFYVPLAVRTGCFRDRLYVVVQINGAKYIPWERWEHFPFVVFSAGFLPAIYGGGKPMTVRFICYSPRGDDLAQRVAPVLCNELRTLEAERRHWSAWQRTVAARREGRNYVFSAMGGPPAYRPPGRR